jgi:DNA-binding MarR family transcriptional regulator
MIGTDRGRKGDRPSKTDLIAGMFTTHPMEVLTPKRIAGDLGLNLQMVTTIVNRLKDQGMIERIGWGKYRLRSDVVLDGPAIEEIVKDFTSMSEDILGRDLHGNGREGEKVSTLIEAYEKVRRIGGEPFAVNVLRICTKRRLDDERAKAIVRMVSGGMS